MQTSAEKAKALIGNIRSNLENRENQEITYSRVPVPFTDDHVLTPTLLARISPFKPLKRGQKRTFHKEVVLYRNQFGYIKYTGQTLGIDDQDIFLQLLRMAREYLFAKEKVIELKFSLRWFLREIGRKGSGGDATNRLTASLKRLNGAQIEIKNKQGLCYFGVLVYSAKINEETGEMVIKLNPELADFYYRYGGYTQLNLTERKELKGDLTKALHMFLSSQRNKKQGHHFEYTYQELAEILNLGGYKRDRRLKESLIKTFHQLWDKKFLLKYDPKDDRVSGVISPY